MINTNRNNFTSIGLLTSQVLLGAICLVNLFVIITYLFHKELSPYLFPAAIIVDVSLNFLLAGKLGIDKRLLLIATVFSVLLLVVSLIVAAWYFDLSWDGQWYQQAAVYNLAENWNPIFRSLATPDKINNSSILYFPKNSWFFGAAVLRLFGNVETGKAYNVIVLFAAFGTVYSLCRDFKMQVWRTVLFTALVLLNPVVWSELTTYLNDGDLYLFLVIYLGSIISWMRNPKPTFILIGMMAAICLVNIKFTGLVFFLVSSLFIFIYILIKQRTRIKPFLLSHLLTGVIALFIFGFNPYVTNMLNRGNPLYPILGSKQFPSVFANGSDDNEAYETPKNMMGKSLPVRLMYANFSSPGNAPYNGEDSAKLAFPLTNNFKSWKAYDYHETRVSGFGPYFGILIVLLFAILPIFLISVKEFRLPGLVFFVGLCCCLSLSKHFWWPRFFPMLWLAPLYPLFLLWTGHTQNLIRQKGRRWSKTVSIYGWLLAAIIGVNGFIVAVVHIQWETVSSVSLRTQLEHIRDGKRPIEVDYGWFKRSMEGKLNHWGIKYTPGSLKASDTGVHMLTSVVEGYPNQVLYRPKTNK